jgi:tRNA dimethylallyltransferase
VRPYPIIAGPTAGGKTALAVEVALRLGLAEIVSADSMLLYRGMDVGSAKPTVAERRGVPHHLIDVRDPGEAYTVHDWLREATAAITDIRARGRTPVVVGGTHLYVKALLDGLFEGPGPDEALRARLRAMDPAERRAELERVDPAAAARLHPNDLRRTVRALEVYRLTGRPISEHQAQWDRPAAGDPPHRLFVIDWPAELINRRINARVRDMMDRGLLAEAHGLWERRACGPQSREALGYKQLIEHFEGRSTLDQAVERIKIETRRFAKNQRTWLRRLSATPGCVRIDASSSPPDAWPEIVLRALEDSR